MAKHRATLDELLRKHNRGPRDVGVFWSIRIQVADSEAHAIEKEEAYINSIPPQAGLIERKGCRVARAGVDLGGAEREGLLCELEAEAAIRAGDEDDGTFDLHDLSLDDGVGR